MKTKKNKMAIVGLGYVGLPLAVAFGKKREVIGFDIDARRIGELSLGFDSTLEISSQELKLAINLEFTGDQYQLKDCGIYIVTVPTPVNSSNRPDLKYLIEASKTIAKFISKDSIVIYESTVYPGCVEEVCVPILERFSNLLFNKDFFCGYSPERINPGDKVNTLTKIKKITSGSTPEVAVIVDELYASIIDAGTWKVSSMRVAEAAKVIENTQRDLNIAFVNELSIIFERLGIDTIEVLEAAGTKWNFLPFRPGMVGGHCIGVDPYYLTHKAEEVGYHPQVILAGRRINDNMARYAARNFVRLMIKNKIDVSQSTVGILGITFKENCPDTRNTKIIDLILELKSWGVNVVIHDPWASAEEVKKEYAIDLTSLDKFINLDSLIVAVGHNQFRNLTPQYLRKMCKKNPVVLADLKAIYSKEEILKQGFSLFRL